MWSVALSCCLSREQLAVIISTTEIWHCISSKWDRWSLSKVVFHQPYRWQASHRHQSKADWSPICYLLKKKKKRFNIKLQNAIDTIIGEKLIVSDSVTWKFLWHHKAITNHFIHVSTSYKKNNWRGRPFLPPNN